MTYELAEERPAFLSTLPAGRAERKLALSVALVSLAALLVIAPLAKTRLPQVWAFIPSYQSALVVSDMITAVLLFSQFVSFRCRALYVLACGYLFTALIAIAHGLTFPGLFSSTGLLGAGPQTTVWLYIFWHAGFPLFVIAYGLLKVEPEPDLPRGPAIAAIFAGALTVSTVVCSLAVLATRGHDVLPALMQGNQHGPMMLGIMLSVWSLSPLALIVLWRYGTRSVLDLWLMVVMCAWSADVALSSVFNGGRFDLGFYTGRLYGLMAASFVLLVLLVESGMLYARLVDLTAVLQRLTSMDALTSIANRRSFDISLDIEWRRAMREGLPLSLLMIDVDFFKRFNDSYGHVAGDDCLRVVSATLSSKIRRGGDFLARYGGEEFAVLLPNTDTAEARRFAQVLCRAIEERCIPHHESTVARHVTVSIGVGSIHLGTVPRSCAMLDGSLPSSLPEPVSLVEAADRALYAAKAAGRNRVAEITLETETNSAPQVEADVMLSGLRPA